MDYFIRNTITLGLPTLMLFIAILTTGKTGDAAVWSGLVKVGGPFGMPIGLGVLIFVGFVANYFSYLVVDSWLVRFYQKRRELEPPEQLLIEIDKLPITNDLKIKLKWAVMHSISCVASRLPMVLERERG